MEGFSLYEEDLWEDDFDEDWFAEPRITYREAVESLRRLVSGRTDVHVDWSGGVGRRMMLGLSSPGLADSVCA